MIKKNLLQMIGIGLGGLVVGYLLGSSFGGSSQPAGDLNAMRGQFGQRDGQTAQRRVQVGGGASGEILKIDDKSITVKMRDGGSRLVFFTSSTPIYKSVSGTSIDLKVGDEISTFGNSGSDGSIVAESIQIRDFAGIPTAPINK